MAYGGADLSTVDPNPTVYSYGDSSAADQFSQAANVVGQWGTAIASIVTGNPVQAVSTPRGVMPVGAAGSRVTAPTSMTTTLLLLLALGLVGYFLLRD